MPFEPNQSSGDRAAAQQRFLSLFLRSEREVYRYVAALVPSITEEIHWQIRNDGVLDLGVQGRRHKDVQIFGSPSVIGLNQYGQWMHLAATVDGERRQVVHYVNGTAVSRHRLRRLPPYRLGPVELGNWNPGEVENKSPFLIRYFSGSMDELTVFGRALNESEIRQLYSSGSPYAEPDRLPR